MKKLICMACALILLLGLAGCKEAGPSLYDQGMKTVELLAEAIRSEEYLDLMTVAKPLREIISDAAAGDYSVPKAAFQLTFPDETLQAFASLILYENFPDQDMAALQALFGGAVKIELLSE